MRYRKLPKHKSPQPTQHEQLIEKLRHFFPRLRWPQSMKFEKAVAHLLMEGASRTEISQAVNLSHTQVPTFVKNLVTPLTESSVAGDYWHLSKLSRNFLRDQKIHSRDHFILRFGNDLTAIRKFSGVGQKVYDELCRWVHCEIPMEDWGDESPLYSAETIGFGDTYLNDLRRRRAALNLTLGALDKLPSGDPTNALRRTCALDKRTLIDEMIHHYHTLYRRYHDLLRNR